MEKLGFELLKTRQIGETVPIQKLEAEYGLKIPPLYKLFINLFKLGERKFNKERYYLPENNDFYYCEYFYYCPRPSIMFANFIELDLVFECWKNKWGYSEENIKSGLLKIGDLGTGGGLFLGIDLENRDQIYVDIWDEGVFKLTDNIFQFVQGLKSEPDPDILKADVSFSDFYKNWGEDFWRLKRSFD